MRWVFLACLIVSVAACQRGDGVDDRKGVDQSETNAIRFLGTAVEQTATALQGISKEAQTASGEPKETLLDVQEMLDSAGSELAELAALEQAGPDTLDQAQDAYLQLRDAEAAATSIPSQSTGLISEARDTVRTAIVLLGGEVEE